MSFDLKICKKCSIEKSILDFSICSVKTSLIIYYRAVCKECRKQQQHDAHKKYYNKNKIKIRAKGRENYHNSDKKKIKEYKQKYNVLYGQKNKQKLNQNSNDWQKKKRKNDPIFALRKNISCAINSILNISGFTKNGQSFLQFVPWTIEELKEHLEKQFETWMSWKNRGNYIKSQWNTNDHTTWKWNIDHIIPQSDLLYSSMEEENFKKCWSLSNLRPYSAKQNLIDGANRTRHNKKR